MIRNFSRAALCAALAFSTVALAQKTPTPQESARDIIEKAQNLILQRDRAQALTILTGALRREKGKPIEAELRATLESIASVFLSDRTQQTYEASISIRKIDLNQSLQRLQEALVMEPDNLTLLTEQARQLIAKGDCKGAESALTSWNKKFASLPLLVLTQAQIEFCQSPALGSWKTAVLQAKQDSERELYWYIVGAERAAAAGDRNKALELANIISKKGPEYPDKSYWQWKFELRTHVRAQLAEKYLMTCKNISAATYRQYMMDPMLCRRISEEDAEPKGPHGSTN